MHRAPGACGVEVREHRGQPASGRDLKKIYQSATVLEAEEALEEFAQVGREVSDDLQAVACEVDRHHHAVRVPAADPQSDLHDQRDRIGQQRDSQVHAQPQAYPNAESALKLIYMAIHEASKKWTMPIHTGRRP